MKGLAILFLVFIVLFGGQALYYGGQIDSRLEEASAALPDDPDSAYLKIKPVFEYSNITTFGKADSAKRAFFVKLADSFVERLEHGDNMKPEFFKSLYRGFSVMKTAEKETGLSFGDERLRILEAAKANHSRLSETLTLSSWDAFLNTLKALEKDGGSDGYSDQLAGWIAEARAVDRRAIGMRTGRAFGEEALGAAIRALALEPSEPNGPLIGALPKPVDEKYLLEAERHFQNGEEFVLGLQRGFNEREIPAELKTIYAKLLFNHASMRIAHLMDAGPRASTEVTYYIANLYSNSSGDDNELYGAFVKTVSDQLHAATAILAKPGALPPAEAETLEALAKRAMGQFCQARGDRNGTTTFAQQFQEVAARPSLPGAAAENIKRMSATDRGFIILR